MSTLNDIQVMWSKDCKIGEDLGQASIESPMLHSKYLDELIAAKLKHTKCVAEIAEMKTLKSKYFRGEMTKDELAEKGWQQWQYKTIKADIMDHVEADPDYQKLHVRAEYMRTTIYALESILNEIKNRNWAIRANLDWQRFRSGA
jgi:hypothetical protein